MQRIRLRYLSGPRTGQVEVYPIARHESLSLGRDASCDVRFHPQQDVIVSRNHAMIEWSADSPPLFRISDLLSSNGTFLNGRRIGRSVLLRAHDQIQLGTGGPVLEFDVDDVLPEPSEAPGSAPRPSVTQEMDATTIRGLLPDVTSRRR